MPAVKGAKQDKATIAQLKEDYIRFYADCPIQKYAAMAICRDEETIKLWRDEDPDFAHRVKQVHAFWTRKKLMQTQAAFALERLEKDIFAERKEMTGPDGADLFAKATFKISSEPNQSSE